jgi:predicted amidohydrolase
MKRPSLTIALAQTDVVLGDKARNLARGHRMAAQAAAQGAQLLLFPELWTTGYDLARTAALAESIPGGPTVHEVSSWARDFDMWIVGSMLERTHEGVFNAAALFGPGGQIVGPYRKIHRFGPMAEDRWLEAGCEPGLFDLPWGRTGVAICYDLRFPELFRGYAVAGARLILIPSEWPHPRLHHWRTLVQARAIENQCFVAAVNRVGSDRDHAFCGHSMLVGPWGDIIVEAAETPDLRIATIDLTQVDETRGRIPVLTDRRPECYQ